MATSPNSTPETLPEHSLELPENPVTSLNLVAMAAEDWGGLWQAEGPSGGRLGLPVIAGLRRGWVAGQLTVEPAGDGSRLTYRIDKSDYQVQKAAALTLFVAGLGAITIIIAPLFPALFRLVPIGIVLSLMAWFFVIARLRNSGPEEFFEDLARGVRDEQSDRVLTPSP